MQFPPSPTQTAQPLLRGTQVQTQQARQQAPETGTEAPRHPQLSELPQSRSQGTQVSPSTCDVGTQVSDLNFTKPAGVDTRATVQPLHGPAPLYQGIDHGATRNTRVFLQEIREAQAVHGSRVSFTRLQDGKRDIGYILSARNPLPAAATQGRRPALYLAGSSIGSQFKARFAATADIFTIAGDPASPTAAASELRREKTQLAQGRSYVGKNVLVPNYNVGSRTLKAMEAAQYVSNAGRSAEHTQPVDVFVAAPGQSVHLSTVMRALTPGVYGGVIYAMH